jgi:hypothetical protein
MDPLKILVLKGQQYSTSDHCLLVELVQKFPSFMELKGSLPTLQESTIGLLCRLTGEAT